MKILIVTPDYPISAYSGGGNVAKAIAELLAHRHNVQVVSLHSFKQKEILYERRNGVEITWLPCFPLFARKLFPQFAYSLLPNLDSFFIFARSINFVSFDVIHFLGFPGHLFVDLVFLCSENRNKVLTVHAFPKFPTVRGGPTMKFLYKMYLLLLVREIPNKSKLVIVPSSSVAREAVKLGVDPTRIHIIPNGIFMKTYYNFKPLEAIKSAMEKKHSVNIVSIGRIVWYKGYEYAIRAIYELSRKMNIRIDYYVVGEIQDLRYFAILTSLVRNLHMKDKVHFLGSVPEAVKLSVLKCADIYLAPSLYDGFGLTIVEAMAMGKPVVATNTAGHKDILRDHETGLLFMPGDVNDLSSQIYKLIRNPDLAETLVHNALIESIRYDWASIIDRYEVAYKVGQN